MASVIVASILLAATMPVTAARGDLLEWGFPIGASVETFPILTLIDSATLATKRTVTSFGPPAVGGVTTVYTGDEILDGALTRTARVVLPSFGSSIATDSAGNAYTIGLNGILYVYDRTGTVLRQMPLPGGPSTTSIDLAPDQCTLLYLDTNQRLRRFDLCTVQPLPALAQTQRFFFVRALADGGFVGYNLTAFSVFESNGNIAGTFSFAGDEVQVHAVAFSSDASAMYVVLTLPRFVLRKIRLADGFILAERQPLSGRALAVFGEQRPTTAAMVAAATASAAAVPALSPWLLAMLSGAMIAIAMLRLRAFAG